MATFNIYLMENFSEAAKALFHEAKRLEAIAEINPICSEAADLIDGITERLNTLASQAKSLKDGMIGEAQAHADGLIRPVVAVKSRRASRNNISAGEREKRRLVKKGATLVRGAF